MPSGPGAESVHVSPRPPAEVMPSADMVILTPMSLRGRLPAPGGGLRSTTDPATATQPLPRPPVGADAGEGAAEAASMRVLQVWRDRALAAHKMVAGFRRLVDRLLFPRDTRQAALSDMKMKEDWIRQCVGLQVLPSRDVGCSSFTVGSDF